MNRTEIATMILTKLKSEKDTCSKVYHSTKNKIGYFYIDDLLPEQLTQEIFNSFPEAQDVHLKKTIREYKYIAVKMNNYSSILEETIYAFQDSRVINIISEICDIQKLSPDEKLYAGGLSMMGNKHYLNPHLDNSHNKEMDKWRVLNLLFYVTPNWSFENGGNLELWPDGIKEKQITIHSKFNRLVVMATHESSWHSVSPINSDNNTRCCVSNYFFSENSLKTHETFHITTFRGRPEQKMIDKILRIDGIVRTYMRKIAKRGFIKSSHFYEK